MYKFKAKHVSTTVYHIYSRVWLSVITCRQSIIQTIDQQWQNWYDITALYQRCDMWYQLKFAQLVPMAQV